MREIVFDTETTGLDPEKGDRIVEIGCVELVNHLPTGRTYQRYLNPDREMSEDVIAVHGLTNAFLSDKPRFSEIVDEFLDFIGNDSKLVAHNASFDMKFVNAELQKCGREPLSYDRVIDTLIIARQKFPGSRVNLNELCKRFNVDTSARTVHGALLDSELLADVYLELVGGREMGLALTFAKDVKNSEKSNNSDVQSEFKERPYHEPRIFTVSQEELEAHTNFMYKIPDNFWGIKKENDV